MTARLLSIKDREPAPDLVAACCNPGSAQFHLWVAQSHRDHKMISDNEMAVVERIAGPMASKSVSMFNPFTGEIRKVQV